MRVGFIGLGDQGRAMARRITDVGFSLTLWARRPASLEPFSDSSAEVVGTPVELGQRSDVVGICVVDDAGVLEVVGGPDGVLEGMSAGGIIAIHSTVHPDTCIHLAKLAAQRGVRIVDAPVSGGGVAAAERRLLVLVGGDDEDVNRCMPVFSSFGDPIRHLGPLGSGQRAKLINNALMAAHLGLAHDALELGKQLGMDPQPLGEALQSGSGRSFGLDAYARSQSMSQLASNVHPLLEKDVGILAALADLDRADSGALLNTARYALDLMDAQDDE